MLAEQTDTDRGPDPKTESETAGNTTYDMRLAWLMETQRRRPRKNTMCLKNNNKQTTIFV